MKNETMNAIIKRNKWLFAMALMTLPLSIKFTEAVAQVKSNFYFKGHFEDEHAPDSITFYIWDRIISENKKEFAPHRSISVPVINGSFLCKTSVKDASYTSIGWGSFNGSPKFYLELCLVNGGDSIDATISYTNKGGFLIKDDLGQEQCMNCYGFDLRGKGAAKYQAQQEIDKAFEPIYNNWSKVLEQVPQKDTNRLLNDIIMTQDQGDYFVSQWLGILSKYKSSISASSYQQLATDITSRSWLQAFSGMTYIIAGAGESSPSLKMREAISKVESYAAKRLSKFPAEALTISPYYAELRILQSKIGNKKEQPTNTFQRILQQNSGATRDRIIANFVYNNESTWNSEDRRKIFISARKLVSNEPYAAVLTQIEGMQKGSKVYNFALPDTAGTIIKLSDFSGKVVFIDFWFVGCMGCIDYYKSTVSKVEHVFKENQDVVFITISIDVNKEKWLAGINSGKYTSHEVVNLHTFPSGTNHPVIQQFSVKSYPHPLLIDRQGNVFSNSEKELRDAGVKGLTEKIQEALKKNTEYSQTTDK